jgi:hypothetical protein
MNDSTVEISVVAQKTHPTLVAYHSNSGRDSCPCESLTPPTPVALAVADGWQSVNT